MRYLFFLLILGTSYGCCQKIGKLASTTYPIESNLNTNLYKIDRIDSILDFYVIYASKGTLRIKILSNFTDELVLAKIRVGSRYDLELFSILKDIAINGKRLPNLPNNSCIGLNDTVSVCIEPQNFIFNIYKAKNLTGLYFHKLL